MAGVNTHVFHSFGLNFEDLSWKKTTWDTHLATPAIRLFFYGFWTADSRLRCLHKTGGCLFMRLDECCKAVDA
ncbi:hypothetical protein DPMN_048593 [Dreissena polymorpha]|uniref:Uncharacterized protein n=1 Tax=Dreissena polymorpha TaxID=45954 RepID=A0A9D4I2J5_DREPO|nr:hypothetical protein DPMN_048593 [Dreissena polymorpha]